MTHMRMTRVMSLDLLFLCRLEYDKVLQGFGKAGEVAFQVREGFRLKVSGVITVRMNESWEWAG